MVSTVIEFLAELTPKFLFNPELTSKSSVFVSRLHQTPTAISAHPTV